MLLVSFSYRSSYTLLSFYFIVLRLSLAESNFFKVGEKKASQGGGNRKKRKFNNEHVRKEIILLHLLSFVCKNIVPRKIVLGCILLFSAYFLKL